MKYYFRIDDERCYTKKDQLDYMRCNDISEMEVFEAEIDDCKDYFFCGFHGVCGESGECGNSCDDYKPRNKIKGICIHHSKCYTFGKSKTLKL